ncbi:flagellar basal-body rod protein FlgF [bacterium]|nr:flagellar basal-body rod protein FlgF [bacterium]
MYRGLYAAALGMNSQWTNLEVVANNMANISSPGYKKDEAVFSSTPKLSISRLYDNIIKSPAGYKDTAPFVGGLGTGVGIDDIVTIHSDGPIQPTENPFDLAIQGNGFFCIWTPAGERYTRDGRFTKDQEGYLSTISGNRVLSDLNLPIEISEGDFVVDENGVVFVDREEIEKLKIVAFEKKEDLIKTGGGLFKNKGAVNPKVAEGGLIKQGYLELSNVNAISEMVKMIEVQRLYEANQRVVLAYDDVMRRGIDDVGRIA